MSKKIQLINLYTQSFDDSKEYVENFFTQYYVSKNVECFTDNGTIISALYLMPKNLNFYGKIWRLPFIVGAATLKEYRQKGYFKKLLKKTLVRLTSTNTPFVMLYPANRELYKKLGFVDVSFCGKTKLCYDGVDSFKKEADCVELSSFFINYLGQHSDIHQSRNPKEMEKIAERWAAEGLFAEIYERDGKYCYIVADGNQIEEVVGDVSVLNGVKKYIGREVEDFCKQDEPYAMARLVSPVRLLEGITYCADGDFKFKVTDDLYSPNNMTVHLEIRKGCPTVSMGEKFDFEISGADLLRLSFGQKVDSPLAKVFDTKKVVFVDKY